MTEEINKPLVVSIVGPMMNKVKSALQYARKNKVLAETITPAINVLAEQLLPHFCAKNITNYNELNKVHNLVYLLTHKVQ